jgi:hypothetical protein
VFSTFYGEGINDMLRITEFIGNAAIADPEGIFSFVAADERFA